MLAETTYDLVVVGGGPSGATAANDAAKAGLAVVLLDRAGRIKPCGGAIPPRCIRDFDIPAEMLVARVFSARIISPTDRKVDMPVTNSYVGMVDRGPFDEWLRARAEKAGAERRTGTYESFSRDASGTAVVHYKEADGTPATLRARCVIGADGALSRLGKDTVRGAHKMPYVFAYHEIIAAPETTSEAYVQDRCDVYYRGSLSPDFYAWVFPHGKTMSVGTGSAHKGFSLKGAVADLRRQSGFDGETIRREGAPIPLKPLK
ncbi:geranylgeranyl reductase family protein, partial [Aestuariivirga sp.]|uniref:geranylgeranyl reductase family protein n=1 Tax=Aestuariivirga sp. TaxID=2650926 RepID=UPI0035AF324A